MSPYAGSKTASTTVVGDEFVLVNVTINNKTKTDYTYSAGDWKFSSVAGIQTESFSNVTDDNNKVVGGQSMVYGTVPSGKSYTGELVYQVKAGQTASSGEWKMIYKDSSYSFSVKAK